jgi:hypothetical protein
MTPSQEEDRGEASGWTVETDPEGGHRWSAYGPRGARQGHTESEADAQAAALAAERELKLPESSDGY